MPFIDDLQKQADVCSFGNLLQDQMVHTQIVAGLRDSQLRRITKQQDQILESNPTAADLSEVNDKRVPDHRRGGPKFMKGNDGDKFKRKVQKSCHWPMWSSAKPPS